MLGFLAAEHICFMWRFGCCFQLGGFSLSKTETSLKRQTEDRAVRSLCYHCPEKFHDASFSYCKEWEMYRWDPTAVGPQRCAQRPSFINFLKDGLSLWVWKWSWCRSDLHVPSERDSSGWGFVWKQLLADLRTLYWFQTCCGLSNDQISFWTCFSFGIILWEIVTCKNPFEGLCLNYTHCRFKLRFGVLSIDFSSWRVFKCLVGFSDEKIYQKVYEEKYQEPLPDDCPAELGQLINECRAYDGFQRPSAGGEFSYSVTEYMCLPFLFIITVLIFSPVQCCWINCAVWWHNWRDNKTD